MNVYGNASNHGKWILRDAARERFGREVVDGAMQRGIADALGRCVSAVKDASSMKICSLLMAMCLVIVTSGGMAYIERTVDGFADGVGSGDAFYQNALPIVVEGVMHDMMRYPADRSIVRKAGKLGPPIIAGIITSGCAEDDEEGDDASSDMKEPGSYLIRKSNELFGMDSESEEKVDAYLDSVLEETSGAPLFEVTSMAYIEESGILSSGIIEPAHAPTIESQYEYALNADKLAMDMIIKYLNDGDAEEESIKGFIDDESFDVIQELKAKGISIDNYAVTRGDHDANGVMYLKNTFATKEKGTYDMSLNGHIMIKLENKAGKDNPDWEATEIIDHEIYIPTGIPLSDNGFYYLGSASEGAGIIHHAWIEKNTDIPLISEILPKLGKGKELLHVSDYEDAIKQYNLLTSANRDGREERVHHHDGGRIVMTSLGEIPEIIDGVVVNQKQGIIPIDRTVPAGDYVYVLFNNDEDKLRNIEAHDDKMRYQFNILEPSRGDMPNSLIWGITVEGKGDSIYICDGFEENGCDRKPPADGIIDYMEACSWN